MKAVPYSPFNRSYKYMCLQNQLAHNKNKKNARGLTDSNVNVNVTTTSNNNNNSSNNNDNGFDLASTFKSSHKK